MSDDFVAGFLAARDYYGGTDFPDGDHHGAECHKRSNTRHPCTCNRKAQRVVADLMAGLHRPVETVKEL